jgi:hypothetical protein
MLKTEFPTHIPVDLGLLVPPLKTQVEALGLALPNHELWDERHAAWNLLRVGGLLTESEVVRIAQRIKKALAQDVFFNKAATDLDAEVKGAAADPAPAAPEEEEPAGGELTAYLPAEGGNG